MKDGEGGGWYPPPSPTQPLAVKEPGACSPIFSHSTTPAAYSYIRFSHPEQAKGDSLRRQTEAARAWCERNGIHLDTSLSLHDLGKSAFRGEHHKGDKHALGAFIRQVESGRVPEGSYLIIERLDRLTREDVNDALELFLQLKKKIRIVQLSPVEVIHDRHSSPMQLMMALVELMRGRDESQAKSERCGAAWREKKRRARESGEVLTSRLPAWVEEQNGKLRLIKDRAAVVKRIFKLAASGYGRRSIVKRLTEEGVPAFAAHEEYTDESGKKRQRTKKGQTLGSGRWSRSYIGLILSDRRVLGEFQPRDRDSKPDGDPIPNYYPSVVGEAEWFAAREGAAQRRQRPGRIGKHVNIFAGLLRNARDGDSYFAVTRSENGRQSRVLINSDGNQGRASTWSFPFVTFERAILSRLKEIDPREILDSEGGPDETLTLAGQIAGVEAELAEASAFMAAEGFSATIGKRVRALEEKHKELVERLTEARQKAANPLSEAWGEAKTLLGTLDSAPDPDDLRLRLRAVLRRLIDSIWLVVVPQGRYRLCAAQVWFSGGKKYRSYLIFHRPARSNGKSRVEGAWCCRSITHPDDGLPFYSGDLRDSQEALWAQEGLENYPRDMIERLLRDGEPM